MQVQLLKKIVSNIAGQDAEKIVDLLLNKKNVNEFLIAKKLNLTINQTRNILYKLADEGLVKFIRKKDKKKGGWYTYFWTLETEKSFTKFKDQVVLAVEEMKQKIANRQKQVYYYSPIVETEFTEEEALLNNYICPETGEVLEIKDTTKDIEYLNSQIKELESILAKINLEIGDLQVKELKAKSRRINVEKKKKEEERAKKSQARKEKMAKEKAEKNKLIKKVAKGKDVKKKPSKKVAKGKANKKKPSKKRK